LWFPLYSSGNHKKTDWWGSIIQ